MKSDIHPDTRPARTGARRLVDGGRRLAGSGKRFENVGPKGRGIPIV